MIVKLAYKNEIRICSSVDSFSYLLKQVKALFPSSPAHPHLFYIDTDGDKITISSTSDIESLKEISNGKMIKIQIDQTETRQISTQNQEEERIDVIEEEKLLKEIVASNLDRTYERAIKSYEILEEEMIQDIAKFHIHQIGQRALSKVLDQISSEQVSIKSQSKSNTSRSRSRSIENTNNQSQIERLVDLKIKLLIPSLVDKVAKLVELRSQRQIKQNCEQCSKYKRIISQSLLKGSDICNEEEFEEIFELISDSKVKRH